MLYIKTYEVREIKQLRKRCGGLALTWLKIGWRSFQELFTGIFGLDRIQLSQSLPENIGSGSN